MNQTFNDGVLNIYSVGNIAEPGSMPKEGLTLKIASLRYEERIVGMGRFWTAMQAMAKIDMVVRVPRFKSVSTQDVVILDEEQYSIVQIQTPPEITPAVMDLSLQRLEAAYDIT